MHVIAVNKGSYIGRLWTCRPTDVKQIIHLVHTLLPSRFLGETTGEYYQGMVFAYMVMNHQDGHPYLNLSQQLFFTIFGYP